MPAQYLTYSKYSKNVDAQNARFRSSSHLNFPSHFYELSLILGSFQLCYLVFSVEIVEGSEIFSSVAAAIRSTNEVLYYQSNVNQCYSVA